MTKPLVYDVAIIGGGPGGLAAGIGFAKTGLSTIVLEKKLWPIDKICGEGLMPAGVQELEKLGVLALLDSQHTHPFKGLEIIANNNQRAKSYFGGRDGLGIQRTALSMGLFKRAQQEPSLTLQNTKVENFQRHSDVVHLETDFGDIQCRLLVGSDGLRSFVRTKLGAQKGQTHTRRYGANQHYLIPPWSDCVEVSLRDGIEAYVTPCGKDSVGVAFLWHYDRFSPRSGQALIENCLDRFPELKARLFGREKLGRSLATGPLRQRVSNSVHDNIVLIGDAAGYFDAITGEGIGLALTEARILVETASPLLLQKKRIASVDLKRFIKAQRLLRQKSYVKTQLVLWTARHTWLQIPIFALLSRWPRLLRLLHHT